MDIKDIELKVYTSPQLNSSKFSHQVDMFRLRLGQGQRGDLSEIISYTCQAHFSTKDLLTKNLPKACHPSVFLHPEIMSIIYNSDKNKPNRPYIGKE